MECQFCTIINFPYSRFTVVPVKNLSHIYSKLFSHAEMNVNEARFCLTFDEIFWYLGKNRVDSFTEIIMHHQESNNIWNLIFSGTCFCQSFFFLLFSFSQKWKNHGKPWKILCSVYYLRPASFKIFRTRESVQDSSAFINLTSRPNWYMASLYCIGHNVPNYTKISHFPKVLEKIRKFWLLCINYFISINPYIVF